MQGSKTYPLPYSNVPTEVYYEADDDNVTFDFAEINGETINCGVLKVEVESTQKHDLKRSFKSITLRQYFQSKLDDDATDILDDVRSGNEEAREDERNER